MGLSFRKSFKIGPFRTTISNRGVTNSVGAGGVRYSKTTKFKKSNRQASNDLPEPTRSSSAKDTIIGFVVLGFAGFALYALFF